MATVPNFTDLTKMPPKVGTFVNDTISGTKTVNGVNVPTKVKVPFAERAGRFVKPLVPYARAVPGIGTALAVGGTLMSDSDKAPENRTFPKASAVADETRRLQGEADGFFAREAEGLKGALPLVGGLMHDVKDRVANFYGNPFGIGLPDLGPGIELTPGAAEGVKTGIPYKAPVETSSATPPATPAGAATTSGSKYDDLLLAQLSGSGQPKAPEVVSARPNDSYFINNQGGEKPGEKQYFRDLPGTTLNDPQPQAGLPQRLPATEQGSDVPYQSPMVAATENLNLARFNKNDTYSDLLGKRLYNIGEGQSLIPASARTAEAEERRRRGETDREFGLDSLELSQNKEYDDNNLALGRDELEGRDRRSNIDNLVRLRGQDVVSETSRANANTRAAATPLSYEDQLSEQDALTELNLRDFTGAPAGFAEAATNFMHGGASRAQVRNAYNKVAAEQAAAFKTSVDELDAQKLYDAVRRELKQ